MTAFFVIIAATNILENAFDILIQPMHEWSFDFRKTKKKTILLLELFEKNRKFYA